MIKGYVDFYYNVENMDRAIEFYEKALRMEVTYRNEYFSRMSLGTLNLGLHWTEGGAVPLTDRNSHGQNCGGTLTFHSDNISEDRRPIEMAGGKILSQTDQPWGEMLVFEDLDGNVLKLMNPKY